MRSLRITSGVLAGVTLFLLTALAPPVGAADRAAGLSRLVGVWQIDRRVSDDPMRMLRSAADRSPQGEVPALLEERLKPYTEGASTLTIAYDDPRFSVTDWKDAERIYVVGKKVEQAGPRGPVEVETNWGTSDRLVVKIKGDPAGKVIETYEIGGRGEKLFVTVDLYRKGTKRSFSFQRLYYRLDPTD